MDESNFLTNNLESGEQIICKVNSMFKTPVLKIEVNFNPYKHINFAYLNICSIQGIRTLTGTQSNGRNKGQYSFLISKDIDLQILKSEIKQQFENYFIKF